MLSPVSITCLNYKAAKRSIFHENTHLKTSKSLRPPTIHYMQLVYMPWWQHNILTDMPTFFQIITTVLLFDCNCGSLYIWAICDENNHCTKKSTPPSCNYGFEYPCQQAKCTFPIRVPVIGGLFRNLICWASGRVLTSVPKNILQFNSEIKSKYHKKSF